MAGAGADLLTRERRTVGRLCRLFRVERTGGFARRPDDTVQALLRRRGEIIAEFLRLEGERRVRRLPLVPELQRAVSGLVDEVEASLRGAETRLAQLHAELRVAKGEGMPSGIRGSAGGRLIGEV